MYNEKLADRIRELIAHVDKPIEEKRMFGGLCFMVDDKMCICAKEDEIMCRIDPERSDELVEKDGVRLMNMNGNHMKGYLYVAEDNVKKKADLNFWVKACLEYNKVAKASKKKK